MSRVLLILTKTHQNDVRDVDGEGQLVLDAVEVQHGAAHAGIPPVLTVGAHLLLLLITRSQSRNGQSMVGQQLYCADNSQDSSRIAVSIN
eukprot:scaffold38860_cov15-Prasinocladus_malaysianus.AAC.1